MSTKNLRADWICDYTGEENPQPPPPRGEQRVKGPIPREERVD